MVRRIIPLMQTKAVRREQSYQQRPKGEFLISSSAIKRHGRLFMNNPQINNAAALAGRILISIIFIMGGAHKLVTYDMTAGYMQKMGVPGILLPLVILTELGGGLLILAGYQTRLVAFLLAGFTILAGLLFHLAVGDPPNMIHFFKNLAIAGGFLAILAGGPGRWSVDGWKKAAA